MLLWLPESLIVLHFSLITLLLQYFSIAGLQGTTHLLFHCIFLRNTNSNHVSFSFAIFIGLKCGFLLLLFLNELIVTVFQPILNNSIPPVGGNATGPMDHWRELWTLERNHRRSKS